MSIQNDDYDAPWKQAVAGSFQEFLAFFYPLVEAAIDWSRPPVFVDPELCPVARDAKLGLLRLDQLVKVHLMPGGPAEVAYLHIEVQAFRQRYFAKRMFTYNIRAYERFDCPVISLVVLADRSLCWRPVEFSYGGLVSQTSFDFAPVKLVDYRPAMPQLLESGNVFAIIAAGHLATQATRKDPAQRLVEKLALVEVLYGKGWCDERTVGVFNVLDWMMQLPAEQEQVFRRRLAELEGRCQMPYVNSIVRDAVAEAEAAARARGEAAGQRLGLKIGLQQGLEQGVQHGLQQGLQQGMQQGLQQGLQQGRQEGELDGRRRMLAEVLASRFGDLPSEVGQRITQASEPELRRWARRALLGSSIKDVLVDI